LDTGVLRAGGNKMRMRKATYHVVVGRLGAAHGAVIGRVGHVACWLNVGRVGTADQIWAGDV
jgi:hypothetical protein